MVHKQRKQLAKKKKECSANILRCEIFFVFGRAVKLRPPALHPCTQADKYRFDCLKNNIESAIEHMYMYIEHNMGILIMYIFWFLPAQRDCNRKNIERRRY